MDGSRKKTTAYLTQIYGETTNRKFKLMCNKVIIGRSFQAEIRLRNPNISRKHCTLCYTENGWTITDNKSQNGTFISGRKLKSGETRLLQCGDIIFLGPPSEMPEAFCYDDAFVDDEDIPESGHEIIELPPVKRPADEGMTVSKKKYLGDESSKVESNKTVYPSASIEFIREEIVHTQSKEISYSNPDYKSNKKEELFCKRKSPSKIKNPQLSSPLNTPECQTSSSFSANSLSFKKSKLDDSDSGYQIHEISSTGNDQSEDSLSLLDIEKKDIVEPSSSSSCDDKKSVQDSEAYTEVDILKSKLALMAEQMKKIEESKLNLLKNYEVVCEKNFALDQQLSEKKKIEENLKSHELNVQDKIKNELLEKFEEDLICNICTELLIKPTVLDCSHTFCLYCIKEWKKKKNECPICRRKIQTMTPVLTLEHFIDKTLSTLTPEQKERRNQLIKERENQPKKPATPTSRRNRHGRRRYRRPPINPANPANRRSVSSNANENDVEIVGESRSSVLPIPIAPLRIPSMFLTQLRIPQMIFDTGDPIDVYLAS